MDYIIAAAICTISLVIGVVSVVENELFSTNKKRLFVLLAIAIIVEIILDTFLMIMDGTKILPNETFKLMKIVELILVPSIPTIFSMIIAQHDFWYRIRKVFIILIFINTLSQISTFMFPLMFEYRETTYGRTQYSKFYIAIVLIFAILFLVCASKTFVQSRRISYTLVMSVLLVILGMMLRVLDLKSNADWVSISFSYFIFLFYFSSTYLKVEPLTKLLNRKTFDNCMANINYDTAIILIDANNFSVINNTCGHAAGDKALKRIATAIYSVFGKYGYCYRCGGDEFCVVLKKNVLPKLIDRSENYDAYGAMEELIRQLDAEMDRVKQRHPILSDGVSAGYGIYVHRYNTESDDYKTVDEVYEIADQRMYANKKQKKAQLSSEE